MSAVATEYQKLEFTEERLKNGLRLIMSVDRLIPLVAVNLWYDVGSKNEVPGQTGLAHLFEHMMFEGSQHVKKNEHFKLVQSSGGVLNASTAQHRTNYFEWGPSQHLEMMLWLEADRMGGLLEALNQKTLDNQRDVVKNERRQGIDNAPYGRSFERLQNSLFPEGHPYHHVVIGSMDDLSAATLEDVRDFFSTHYAPNNAVLTIVGDFDPKQAKAWVEKYFGGIPANPKLPAPPKLHAPLTLGGEVRESLRDRVAAPGVFIAYRSPEVGTRENDAMTMAGAVLGVGRGSRMYQRLVREEICLAASFGTNPLPGTSISVAQGIAYPGLFDDVVEAGLLKVIDSLQTEPITDQELARARAQVELGFTAGLTTFGDRADWLSMHATLFDDPGRANERLSALMSVTADEIRKVASEVLVPSNRCVVTTLRKPPKPKKRKK